jgi:putative endonuclease
MEADFAVALPVMAPAALVAQPAATPDKPPMIAALQSPAVERVRSTRAQQIGDDGERLAAIRLEALGWRILARNLRVSRAEVDILAIDPSEPPSIVLVEVRRRNRRDFGLAEETVDYRKRNAMRRAAGELAMRPVLPDGRRLPDLPVRVDLIAIDRGPDGRPALRHHRGIEV